jgi:alcohol dehydrogenase class IV
MSFQLTSGKRTIIGEGALETGAPYIRAMGKKALIVTGKVITKTGLADKLSQTLAGLGISSVLFNDIPGEPDDIMVGACTKAFRENCCDFIIGFGGGSPLDTAKAAAAMSVLPGTAADYAGKEMSGSFPPLVLIPTTAGTGSEATKFFVMTDSKTNTKLLLKGDCLLPDLALIDYTYSLSAPQNITAATGMDALTHAVEAYTSRKADPVTDLYALDAVKRIFYALPRCYKDGSDREAREEMAFASYEAGFCINNSSVTIVHGMSRPIGALFHVPHGISNAMLITECLRFALDGAYERFAALAVAAGRAQPDANVVIAADAFIQALCELTRTLQIPTLAQYGIDRAAFLAAEDKMASAALASGSPGNTRKAVTKEDEKAIYERLW